MTGRAAILALVLCAVLLTLAYPLRAYLQQRSKIGDLREQTTASESRVEALEAESRRWEDPVYVAEQARKRLGYVKPGETSYVVLGPDGRPVTSTEPGSAADLLDDRVDRDEAWFDRMMESFARPGLPSGPG